MMPLFEDKLRNRLECSFHSENAFDYYDTSDRKEIKEVRDVLNQWFAKYPIEEQSELKTRFIKTFSSAFFELFLYNLYSQLGCEIVIHPKLKDSEKRPDFLMKKDSLEFYLEAKEMRSESSTSKSQKNMKNNVYDMLNQIDSPLFFLKINKLIIKSSEQPETKNLLKEIKTWLDSLSMGNIERTIEFEGLGKLPMFKQENSKILVELTVRPKTEKTRNKPGVRPIGVYPVQVGYDDTVNLIKKSIKKKASRYGMLDKPYVVAINFLDSSGITKDDIDEAVFGSILISNKHEADFMRAKDGLIMGPKGPINKKVSAFQFMNVHPLNLHVANNWLIKHPFAYNPIDLNYINMTHLYMNNSTLKESKGQTIKEILEIEKNI